MADIVPVELPLGSHVVGVAVNPGSITILFRQKDEVGLWPSSLLGMAAGEYEPAAISPNLEINGEVVPIDSKAERNGSPWKCDLCGKRMTTLQKGAHMADHSQHPEKYGGRKKRRTTVKKTAARRRRR